jgi:hypothetical protein
MAKRNFVAASTGGRMQLKLFLEECRRKQELKNRLRPRKKKAPLTPIKEEPQVFSHKNESAQNISQNSVIIN